MSGRRPSLTWSTQELPEALATAAGAGIARAVPPRAAGDEEEWIGRLASVAGLEADPVTGVPLPADRDDLVLIEVLRAGADPEWWLLAGVRGAGVRVLCRDGRRRDLDRGTVLAAVGAAVDEDGPRWADALSSAGIGGEGRGAPRDEDGRSPGDRVRAWRLRPSSDLPLGTACVRWGVAAALARLAAAHGSQYLLWVGSWWLLGWGALGGRLEPGWIAAWALLLVTRLPFIAAATAASGTAVLRFGLLLRRRLLAGAARQDVAAVRAAGIGQLTGRLLEAAAFETQVFHGGLLTLTAAIELVVAFAVLGLGAGGVLHVALLALWLALAAVTALRDADARASWTGRRLQVGELVVERIAGHTTRVVQQDPELWHEGEDEAAAALALAARRMDRVGSVAMAVVRRTWPLIGIAGLGPALVAEPFDAAGVAVGLGGVLLAAGSLANLTDGVQRLAAAGIAWRRLAPLLRVPDAPSHDPTAPPPPGPGALSVRDLRVARGGRPILDGLELEVPVGEHVRVEGRCGSGKTTLAETVLGLAPKDGGLVLVDGLDPEVLGREWRRRLGGVPEAARDRLLSGSLAFNLLLGRGWPPSGEGLELAEAVCRTLGLGGLVDRMPGGLHTQVGDTGWQLSHGERTRVLLGRALIRDVGTLVLDTPGEGLDPVSSERVAEVLAGDRRGVLLLDRPR